MNTNDRTGAALHGRRRLLGTAAAWLGLSRADAAPGLPIEGEMPSLGGATAWLNTRPLSTMALRGKVVLVDFWTLTCINWLRTFPHVRAWATKYQTQGLVVLGVHTPEFGFEQDLDNVRRAVRELGLDYPIAVDSDSAVWRAFQNHYWPALYFVDAQGRIRHHHFGEGDYEESERVIQQLLIEAGRTGVASDLVSVAGTGVQAAADWANLKSPETYIGYARAEGFASPGGIREDTPYTYRTAALQLDSWSLAGVWTVGEEFAALNEAAGRITHRFRARDLHLVLTPSMPGRAIRFRIRLDGSAPGDDHGGDVNADGLGTVSDGRLYQLVRQTGTVGERTFEIEFLDPGVRAYAFTFG